MKRRQFLKSVFGVVAGLAAAPSVVRAKPLKNNVFEVNKECLKPTWTKLGCKDCYKGCPHFNDCLAILKLRIERAEKAANHQNGTYYETYDLKYNHAYRTENNKIVKEWRINESSDIPIITPSDLDYFVGPNSGIVVIKKRRQI